jgi:hypothetical protein
MQELERYNFDHIPPNFTFGDFKIMWTGEKYVFDGDIEQRDKAGDFLAGYLNNYIKAQIDKAREEAIEQCIGIVQYNGYTGQSVQRCISELDKLKAKYTKE